MPPAATFAMYLVPESVGVKREVRCNSGAIPVAVSSLHVSQIVGCEYLFHNSRFATHVC